MKNKEIQEERIRGYFKEATKSLIKGEGIRSVSVRSVADHAGYSFATIYNYFKDVNELVFQCVHDFNEECRQYTESILVNKGGYRENLRSRVLAYVNYFTEYPGIFELFFTARAGDLGNNDSTLDIIEKSLDNVCETEWNDCINNGIVTLEKAKKAKSRLRYAVTGLLLMYLNRRRPISYTDFRQTLEDQVDDILDQVFAAK